MTEPAPRFRPGRPEDHDLVKQTLYLALAWDPADPIPPMDVVVAHPEITKYHADWMRPGDSAVVAEVDGEFAGMAYYRLFTDDDRGQGYLNPETPELAIAIPPEHRGKGIGTRLMNALADVARASGIRKISLSVSEGNPAARLYERLGYRHVSEEDDELMVLELG
jgi:ribosomal protein S18 acetylase RimI-like enzyme